MQELKKQGYEGQFSMIYFDGPFNSGWVFSSYSEELKEEIVDPWNEWKTIRNFFNPGDYRNDYRKRIEVAKHLLADEGILVFHTSQKEGHYLKVILDEVFGERQFLGEVVWKFANGPVYQKAQFGLNHETLFFYAKSEAFTKKAEKCYSSVWDDIGTYDDMQAENTYYATQKPEKLIERILDMTTEAGALVGDFYCGSGTLPLVAQKMNRRWIASDNSRIAIQTAVKRLSTLGIEASVHQIIEDFNLEYLQEKEYTKRSEIPFSLYELKGLKRELGDVPIKINAFDYTDDIDLIGDHSVVYQFIMPGRSCKSSRVPRPVPAGDGLRVSAPFEWIYFHLKHGKIEEYNYHVDQGEMEDRVKRSLLRLNGNWIKEKKRYDHYERWIDIFGHSYVVRKERKEGENWARQLLLLEG
ncbi:DNA methyltransferase [Ammoniphilus sp. YIM 78166]|uniref:DNA methyltransferase n=1 Tax=Ammoniphilus sp. YIM 78166 TaxID=1644106 RepID=UPI001431F899|nr:site-specific DNA-methyltransferase [Ammoniphilus sp. YIM 78166]